jgi:hypothetical protein
MKQAQKGLGTRFVIHFKVEMLVGISLVVFPEFIMPLPRWRPVDPIASRVVRVALKGFGRNWEGMQVSMCSN